MRPIRKFRISPSLSNRIGSVRFESNLEYSQVPSDNLVQVYLRCVCAKNQLVIVQVGAHNALIQVYLRCASIGCYPAASRLGRGYSE